MGSVYPRGDILWVKFKNLDGHWQARSTGLPLADLKNARKVLRHLESQVAAKSEFQDATGISGPVTVREFASNYWISERRRIGIADWRNEESRLRDHVFPHIGEFSLDAPVEARHIAAMVSTWREDSNIASKTLRNIYSVTRGLFRDAEIMGLIDRNPCILTRHQLGPCEDKDPEFRANAIFERDEVETLISVDEIPEDRQVHYALKGIAALREGEADGIRWRHYELKPKLLNKLIVATSYDNGRTKSGQSRLMPVHPTLAAMLDDWKLKGWPEMMGRKPTADDLIVPRPAGPRTPLGRMRDKNYSQKRLKEDLKNLGLRHRRGHDLRRTLISLAISDGARKDLLNLCTHGPPRREGIDAYITIGWEPLCAEIAKLKISRAKPTVVPPDDSGDSPIVSSELGTVLVQSEENTCNTNTLDDGGAGNRTRVRR
jgi:integrase